MTTRPDLLTGFDYGIKTAVRIPATSMEMEPRLCNRPHSSPAMERALQRIETEIPARMRALRERAETEATERKAA